MKFYILAPADIMSGGPELAHQLCETINRLTSYKAYMCYVGYKPQHRGIFPMDISCPIGYKMYQTEHAINMNEIDQEENVVIVPEGLTFVFSNICKAKKVLWWMSVDNYIITTNERDLDAIGKESVLHLWQSYYAKRYIEEKIGNVSTLCLTDYINMQHGQFLLPGGYRNNAILYNPKKGKECVEELMKKITWLQWIPVINLNLEEVIVLMQSSKIYVDFGNHPGKDRIPREAAANGCCVITNKKGSAAFVEDVPIQEKYKFENPLEQVAEIESLFHDICDNYQEHMKQFDEYRAWIHGEKERFEEEAIAFVNYMEQYNKTS